MTLSSFHPIPLFPEESLKALSFLILWLPLIPYVYYYNSKQQNTNSCQDLWQKSFPNPTEQKFVLVEVRGQFRLRIWSMDLSETVQKYIIKRARCRLQGCNSNCYSISKDQKWTLQTLVLSNPQPALTLLSSSCQTPPFPPEIMWSRSQHHSHGFT